MTETDFYMELSEEQYAYYTNVLKPHIVSLKAQLYEAQAEVRELRAEVVELKRKVHILDY